MVNTFSGGVPRTSRRADIASCLRAATLDLIDKPVIAAATHTHADHAGGHHEFEDCLVHRAEAENLRAPDEDGNLYISGFNAQFVSYLNEAGYPVEPDQSLITALPHAGYDPATYGLRPSRVTHIVEDGSAVDTGDRHFEVLHLPGHSPGSIGLWEEKTGILFSGDCIYDGALLDGLGHSDIPAYRTSLKRLRRLPVTIVHAGHEPSFGRARLHELIDAYLARRGD